MLWSMRELMCRITVSCMDAVIAKRPLKRSTAQRSTSRGGAPSSSSPARSASSRGEIVVRSRQVTKDPSKGLGGGREGRVNRRRVDLPLATDRARAALQVYMQPSYEHQRHTWRLQPR